MPKKVRPVPKGFTTVSPHKKPQGKKDTLLVAAIILAILGFLAAAGVIAQVLMLQPPA